MLFDQQAKTFQRHVGTMMDKMCCLLCIIAGDAIITSVILIMLCSSVKLPTGAVLFDQQAKTFQRYVGPMMEKMCCLLCINAGDALITSVTLIMLCSSSKLSTDALLFDQQAKNFQRHVGTMMDKMCCLLYIIVGYGITLIMLCSSVKLPTGALLFDQ